MNASEVSVNKTEIHETIMLKHFEFCIPHTNLYRNSFTQIVFNKHKAK